VKLVEVDFAHTNYSQQENLQPCSIFCFPLKTKRLTYLTEKNTPTDTPYLHTLSIDVSLMHNDKLHQININGKNLVKIMY